MEWLSFSIERFWDLAINIAITVILTLPIGWERLRSTHTMALRTYMA